MFDDRCFNVVEDERPVEDDEEEDDEIFSSSNNVFNSQIVGSSSSLSQSRFCIAKDYIRVIGHLI